jgi:hypothetical protein
MPEAYIAVAGGPREKLDLESGATVADILKEKGIERTEGDVILVGDRELNDKDTIGEGETLVYVPPVMLG